MMILDVLMRYLHVVSAVLTVGGAFFIAFLLPGGLALIDEPKREVVLLKVRRAFKMIVHPAVLFLIVTGAYNSWRLWPTYKINLGRHHAFWGPHLLFGVVAMGISIWLLSGRTLRPKHRTWMRANVALLLVVIALASMLRSVRLNSMAEHHQAEVNALKAAAATPTMSVPSAAVPATLPALPE